MIRNEKDKTAYPITCQRCEQDFVIHAHSEDVEAFKSGEKTFKETLAYLVGGDYSLFCSNLCDGCWNGLFNRN
jgi:hypothetical protein|tara:strand:+ start:82 stop:300 length:219 start_codon:yes stop_codon:yes gene_type:complete